MRSRITRVARPEVTIVVLAVANLVAVWWAARETPDGGEALVWFFPFRWTNEPSRILLASILLMLVRPGSRLAAIVLRLVAVVLSAELLTWVVYGCLASNYFRFCFDSEHGREYLVLVQGALAAMVVCAAGFRLLHSLVSRSWCLRIGLVTLLVVSVLGWVSSALATPRCEEIVADWVAREVYGGRPFAVVPIPHGWSNPEDVFRRVGARIVSTDTPAEGQPAAAGLEPATHPAPFLVRVQLYYRPLKGAREMAVGRFLFFAGPGFAMRLKFAEPYLPLVDDCVIKTHLFPW